MKEWEDPALEERYQRLLSVREVVSKALEEERAAKRLGNSLEGAVVLQAPPKLQAFLKENEPLLKDLFIVSQVEIVEAPPAGAYASKEVEGLTALIRRTDGRKCERCWVYDPKTGENPEYPAACPRWSAALRTLAAERKA